MLTGLSQISNLDLLDRPHQPNALGMRRSNLARPAEEGLEIIDRCPYVYIAWSDDASQPCLRAVHGVRVGPHVYFHGARVGQKSQVVGRAVVLQAAETIASIPSYFTDPERACPATTFYRSVQIEGHAELVPEGPEKADAMQALMRQFQPEGGHLEICERDPGYQKALRTVSVVRVRAERMQSKANFGQAKPLATQRTIIEALWNRGEAKDPETIELMRSACARDPAPAWLTTNQCTLHGWASPAHAAEVAAHLESAYWNEGVTRQAILTAHLESSAWVIAKDGNGKLVGTARAVSDGAKHAWIYDVWVMPTHRGAGIATALLELLLKHPRVRGARLAHLCTKDAQPLYRRLGFVEASVSRNPHMVRAAEGSDHAPVPRGD